MCANSRSGATIVRCLQNCAGQLSRILCIRLWLFAIAKSCGNPVKKVLAERVIPKQNVLRLNFTIHGVPRTTLAQIEDEIRTLRAVERIELYKWLDHFVVADCGANTSFRSRLGVDRSLFSPIQREGRKGERASRTPQIGRAPGRVPQSNRSRQRARLSFVSGRLGQNREAIAPAAGAHRRRGHAQTTAQASGVAGSLFASLIPGDRHHEFSGKRRHFGSCSADRRPR
jgi:hypothetical protein